MRVLSQAFLLCVLTVCMAAAPARTQEYSAVPVTTEQIADPTLRSVLLQHSPNYNFLVRPDQIRAYVNTYQSLYGTQPPLTANDATLLTQATQPQILVVPAQPQVHYYPAPPTYYRPQPGFSFGFSFGNNRWDRPGWHRPPPNFGPGRPGGRPPSPGPNRPGGRPPRPRPR